MPVQVTVTDPAINLSEIISTLSLFLSGISFAVSFAAFRRDDGNLDVSLSLGQIHTGIGLQPGPYIVQIKVVNSGRRNVTITSIGGKNKWHGLRTVLSKLTFGKISPWAYVLMGPEIHPILFGADRNYRTLKEGEVVTAQIEIPAERQQAWKLFECAVSFGVTDSRGRDYWMPKKLFKNFQAQLREHVESLSS